MQKKVVLVTLCDISCRYLTGQGRPTRTAGTSTNTTLPSAPAAPSTPTTMRRTRTLSSWWTLRGPSGPCTGEDATSEATCGDSAAPRGAAPTTGGASSRPSPCRSCPRHRKTRRGETRFWRTVFKSDGLSFQHKNNKTQANFC